MRVHPDEGQDQVAARNGPRPFVCVIITSPRCTVVESSGGRGPSSTWIQIRPSRPTMRSLYAGLVFGMSGPFHDQFGNTWRISWVMSARAESRSAALTG